MPSGFSAGSQNGYSSGALSGVSIASNGMVEGLYSNGLRAPVGQLVIAMIQHQRGYSANSKVIATADDMLTTLMQLKR